MKKTVIFFLITAVILSSTTTKSKFSFGDVTALFGSYPFEDIVMLEFDVEKDSALALKNIDGDITVKTGADINKIYVTAIKRAPKQEDLNNLIVNHKMQTKEDAPNALIISSHKNKQQKGVINYVLTVPSSIHLALSTETGNLIVNKAHGITQLKTGRGAITVNHATEKLVAHNEYGPITINHANGQIKAITDVGDIFLKEVTGTIIAESTKGSIHSSCIKMQGTNRLQLHTEIGSILVSLPATVSANFYGKTTKGTLVSELPLTLKPITTKLDTSMWKRFKQEIDGTFGQGEAEIRLSSNNGNIKIVETA